MTKKNRFFFSVDQLQINLGMILVAVHVFIYLNLISDTLCDIIDIDVGIFTITAVPLGNVHRPWHYLDDMLGCAFSVCGGRQCSNCVRYIGGVPWWTVRT